VGRLLVWERDVDKVGREGVGIGWAQVDPWEVTVVILRAGVVVGVQAAAVGVEHSRHMTRTSSWRRTWISDSDSSEYEDELVEEDMDF